MAVSAIGDSALAARLRREIAGEVRFDAFTRGRYATDASIYQIEPVGVVVPRDADDAARAMATARAEGVPVLPRGGGTSQCGQTVGPSLVIDTSRHMTGIVEFDAAARRIVVEPGLVLDRLNDWLRPHGLFFPVDPSTSAQCTIGGMTANNSAGARSIRYGLMADNVRAIDAILADGSEARFADVPANLDGFNGNRAYAALVHRVRAIAAREASEIKARFPEILRRVGGYNIDSIDAGGHNMARLLIGSEGTLAFFKRIELALQPIPAHRVMGVCHFDRFRDSMAIPEHIVTLDPTAVELVDRTMIGLARAIPAYRDLVARFVRGDPAALLFVEFAGDDRDALTEKLRSLEILMADHGFPGAVLDAADPGLQRDIGTVRRAGLNIMMSMKGDGKPVSFIEDCAVPLPDLADYTERLNDVFARHGTEGTWYAHASVGCLHVRPILNMKDQGDVTKMRAIAEEAFAMVREYKGSHSGEHGDGLARSEFHEPMFGPRIAGAFVDIKRAFDPDGLFNPGKIVDASKMDDRSLFRFKPGYRTEIPATGLDWGEWGGFAGAVEMCNNNGECRKGGAGVMCPSFRVTGDEQHVTRGRANTLRLAISGQLGPDALYSDEMAETLELCVGCKGCKRECPLGVDMARLKIEALHLRLKRRRLTLRARAIAYLPRYAPFATALAPLLNLPGLAWLSRRALGFTGHRPLPRWRRDVFRDAPPADGADGPEVVLLADTFTSRFEPEIPRAALRVLRAAGVRVHIARAADGGRPLCCGRSFLSQGLIEEARAEARRLVAAILPFVARGVPVIGLEPSCLLTLRDELKGMLPGPDAEAVAGNALLFEEFVIRHADRLKPHLGRSEWTRALLHGHCHQKAFGAMGDVAGALALVPGLEVDVIQSGCCGMAGAFGYEAEHYDLSMKMAELDLLPAVRAAGDGDIIVADGTSCRSQIDHGAGRKAAHVAEILAAALAPPG